MTKMVIKGNAFIDLIDYSFAGIYETSVSGPHSGTSGAIEFAGGSWAFTGHDLAHYDPHGYAGSGIIEALALDTGPVHLNMFGIDYATQIHTFRSAVKNADFAQFTALFFSSDDVMRLNRGGAEVSGWSGNDRIAGNQGDDHILGGDGNDVLRGGGGHDVLEGGLGKDMFYGDDNGAFSAADAFIIKNVSDSTVGGIDRIRDLDDTYDTIDLAAIDADTGTPGDQEFSIAPSFTGVAGALVLTFDAGHNRTVIKGYIDTDNTADLIIYLSGDHHGFAGFNF